MSETAPKAAGIKSHVFGGFVCLIQYLTIVLFDVVIGHTTARGRLVHLTVVSVIFLSMLIIVFRWLRMATPKKWAILILCSTIIVLVHVHAFTLHGTFARQGDLRYDEGLYNEAMSLYQKELNTWYLRLNVNLWDSSALEGMARVHCQKEEFAKAEQVYELIAEKYPDESDDASDKLRELRQGLMDVESILIGDSLSHDELLKLAHIYRFQMHCYRKADEAYRKILKLDIGEAERKWIQENIEELSKGEMIDYYSGEE